jgi:hypothetical protein
MRGLIYRPYEGNEGNNAMTRFSKLFIDRIMRQKLRTFRRAEEENIVVFQQPFPSVFEIPYMKGLGYTIIYDMIDDWSNYRDAPEYFTKTEPYLLNSADIVSATSKILYEKAIQHNPNAYLCPNAADLDHFARARESWERPEDLPIGRPRIGFFGILREWFDTDLLQYCSLQRPGYEFCLIGGYSEVVLEKLRGVSNVHLLGEKPYPRLPEYLRHFDSAIIPFKVNDLIRSTNPIKVYEYLAGGKSVVATAIPEVEGMPFVYASKNPEEFVQNLDQAIQTPVDLAKIDSFLANQTWADRFRVIEGAVLEMNAP